jgi:phosphatidyl-myo-inositol dimannoside synthase
VSRLLIVTRNLPPLTGGMERLNWHLAHELGKSFEVFLCGPHGCRNQSPDNVTVVKTFAAQPLYRFMLESLFVSWRAAQHIRPKLVIAGSGVTAPHALLISRLTGARMIVYLHGLDLIVEHPLYRALFLPSIRSADLALTNSRNTARLARAAGIASERISILHPGVSLPADADQYEASAFRRRIKAGDRPILLSVGRLTPRKGLLEFIRHALPSIVSAKPDVLLVVIGGEASEKLGAKPTCQRQAIVREAERLGLSDHLCFLGKVDEATLSQAYRSSQLHLFPVLDLPGDVEGFGMVAVEAAAHGLPTIAFAVGGIPDAVSHDASGLLIASGDYPALVTAVIDLLEGRHTNITPEHCRGFATRFAWDKFGECARQLCTHIIESRG